MSDTPPQLDSSQKFWIGTTVAALAGTCYWLLKPGRGYFDRFCEGDLGNILPDLNPTISDDQVQEVTLTVKEAILADFQKAEDRETEAVRALADAMPDDETPE